MPPENTNQEEQVNERSIAESMNLDNPAAPNEVDDLHKELNPNDERPAQQNDEGGDEDGEDAGNEEERSGRQDTELENAATDAEREQIRARRRQERVDKRKRQKDRYETLERRLADEKAQRQAIELRMAEIERANLGSQVAQLNQAEQQAELTEQQLNAAKAEAVSKNDGATVVEADRRLAQLAKFKTDLINARQNIERRATQKPQQHLNPDMVKHATAFRQENPWYAGVQANDEHSRIVTAIDAQLTSEGWDPASEAYWQELRSRSAKYLPDRFKKGGAQPNGGTYNPGNDRGSQGATKRTSPVAGGNAGSSGSQQPGGGRQYQLSEARVRAMKDAGQWDDPKQRKAQIDYYKKYDAEQARNNR